MNCNFSKCWNRSQKLKKGFEFLYTESNQFLVITLCIFCGFIPEWPTYLNYKKFPSTRQNLNCIEENGEFQWTVISFQVFLGTQPFKNILAAVSLPRAKSLFEDA